MSRRFDEEKFDKLSCKWRNSKSECREINIERHEAIKDFIDSEIERNVREVLERVRSGWITNVDHSPEYANGYNASSKRANTKIEEELARLDNPSDEDEREGK